MRCFCVCFFARIDTFCEPDPTELYRVPIYLQSDLTHIIEGLESLKNNQEGTEKFIQERKDHIAIIRSVRAITVQLSSLVP